MQQAIQTIPDADSAAPGAAEDVSLTHPAWCDPEQCWSYENAADEPPIGGFHMSREVVVMTDYSAVRLQLAQDHGRPTRTTYLELTTGDPDDGTTRHFTMDQAAELYHALRVLVPGLTNDNTARTLYELGEKNGRRQAERQAREAMPVNGQYVSDDTLQALERIKERFNSAEREKHRAYCLGWVDGTDGRAPAYSEVAR